MIPIHGSHTVQSITNRMKFVAEDNTNFGWLSEEKIAGGGALFVLAGSVWTRLLRGAGAHPCTHTWFGASVPALVQLQSAEGSVENQKCRRASSPPRSWIVPRACVPLKMPAGLFLLCGTAVSNACKGSPELQPWSLDWSSHKALSGPFVPPATFAPLGLLPGSTAELRADSFDVIESNRSSVGLAEATGSGELGHSRSEAAPLQHGQHLAQISMASTVAAFESPCAFGGGTDTLAWLSPEPDAESASGIEARRRIPPVVTSPRTAGHNSPSSRSAPAHRKRWRSTRLSWPLRQRRRAVRLQWPRPWPRSGGCW